MGTRETFRTTLNQACELLGSEAECAKALGIPMKVLVRYLNGSSHVPNELFLKAVDIVLNCTKKRVEQNGAWLKDYLNRHPR